jgi:short-subunit dehydrogenase
MLLIAADEFAIEQAAASLRQGAAGSVEAVQADLSRPEGVDRLYAATNRARSSINHTNLHV